MPSTQPRPERSRPAWVKLALVGLVFFALFLSWRYTPLADFFTAERVMGWTRAVREEPWAPVGVIALYTPAAFVMFPRPLITLFAVLAFGPWYGFAIAMAGIIGSSLATYTVGRLLPERIVHRLAGRRLERTTRAIRKRGLLSVFAVSIAPVAPFPVVGMVAGAVRIKLFDYAAGTMMGMIPGTLATTVFAREIEAALEDPARINYWVVAGVVLILVLLVLGVRRWMSHLQDEA